MPYNNLILENNLIPYITSEIPKENWLIFAPHSDDEIIGMGGSLILAKQKGYRITLVIVTDGSRAGDKNSRKIETEKVANKLNINQVIFLSEVDRNIILNAKLIEKVVKIIDNTKANSIFFPSPLELHPDHRVTTQLVWKALNLSHNKATAYLYEISVQNQINFLVDITNVINEKIELLNIYQSQITQNHYVDYMISMNKLRTYTLENSIDYAEGFYLCKNNYSISYQEQIENKLKLYFNNMSYEEKLINFKKDSENILVSVIITCFNDGEYILDAISSVEKQTYKNIEIIIVDDASTDKKTIDILNKLKIKNKVIFIDENKGTSNARNRGILDSNGIYIFPLDADDKIAPTYIEKAKIILENNDNIGIVYSKAKFFGMQTGEWNLKQYSIEDILKENMIFNSAMFRKKDWYSVGGYNTNMIYGYEDYNFWLSLLNLNIEVFMIQEILFFYRIKNNSRNKNLIKNNLKQASTYLQIIQNQNKLYLKNEKILLEVIDYINTFISYAIVEDENNKKQNIVLKEEIKNKNILIKNIQNENLILKKEIENKNILIKNIQNEMNQKYHKKIYLLLKIVTQYIKSYKEYKIIKKSNFFSEKYYLSTYEDVRLSGIDPIKHYIQYGVKEGRNPNNEFDTKFYLSTYKDVKLANINPLIHYIKYGYSEKREIKKNFKIEMDFKENRIKSEIKIPILIKYHNVIKKIKTQIKQNPKLIKQFIFKAKNEGFKQAILKLKANLNKVELKHYSNEFYNYIEPKITNDIEQEIKNFIKKPLISIIMPVYNVKPKWLDLAIKSIEKQWYKNWELCIVDDKSTNNETTKYLKKINKDNIKIKFLEKNLNISGASNEALSLATGDYIALMDNDDEITIDALYEVVKAINETDSEFIYSDEDKLEMDETFSEPHFKPDFAPDMFLSQNYISHFSIIKRELIDKTDGFKFGLEGSQDYDLYLKILEHTKKIYHIPKVLYHWRKITGSTAVKFSEKSYAQESGKKAIENAIKRRDIDAKVSNEKYSGTYRVKYKIVGNPLISIILPFKDKPELLTMCIEAILNKSTYKNFEIIGISNDSIETETFYEMKRLKSLDNRIKFYEYNIAFNYSKINNYAVDNYANGKHIILLNNDIEIISSDWIESMLEHSQRDDVGCVGAKLYYPNNTIQHAGIIVGLGGVAGHSHKYYDKNYSGYFNRLNIIQNVSAVTGACLMVKKSIYREIDGLNEKNLSIAFNDVDFCLRVQEKGYRNIFTPYCEAYHYESISRGFEDNPKKIARFNSEIEYIKKRHKKILQNGDPYYNRNLTLDREDFTLR